MAELSLQQFNEIFSSLDAIRYDKKKFKKVMRNVVKELGPEGEQGESGEIVEVYQPVAFPEVFVKLEIRTDSYGDNEFVESIKFVQLREKQVVVYEDI